MDDWGVSWSVFVLLCLIYFNCIYFKYKKLVGMEFNYWAGICDLLIRDAAFSNDTVYIGRFVTKTCKTVTSYIIAYLLMTPLGKTKHL